MEVSREKLPKPKFLKDLTTIGAIFSRIRSVVPNIPTELEYETPFQLLMAVILSAQTTDKQVNKTTPALFARVRFPQDMEKLKPEEVENLVRSVNFYRNKARHIHACAAMLVKSFEGEIPTDIQSLQQLPGVGIKTAKVVASVLFGAAHIGVDTHVHRVCNRLGIVQTTNPEATDQALSVLPESLKQDAHHAIVLFGRYHCTARNPKCE